MDKPEHLEDIALDWLVLLHSGNARAADRVAFNAWLSTSEAHASAFAQAQQLWSDVGHTATAAAHVPARRPRRRWPAVAASVLLAAAAALTWQQVPALYADYHTSVGQRQVLTLADGSRVTLNSASALSVDFTSSERNVSLRSGEALFEPATGDVRPFVVTVGDERLQSTNAAFSVRRDGASLTVVVQTGHVQFSGAHQTVLLQADQRLRYRPDQPLLAQQPVDAQSLTAWQRGKLIFNGRPLGEVVGELERYQHGRIVISDRQLAALPVSGVFDLNDPQGLLRTLEQRYPLKVTYLPWLAVVH